MNEQATDIAREIRELKQFLATLMEDRGPKRMLSMDKACGYLGIGRTKGYANIRSHVLTVKHGRRILVPKEELDKLIEKAKRTGVLFE